MRCTVIVRKLVFHFTEIKSLYAMTAISFHLFVTINPFCVGQFTLIIGVINYKVNGSVKDAEI